MNNLISKAKVLTWDKDKEYGEVDYAVRSQEQGSWSEFKSKRWIEQRNSWLIREANFLTKRWI